MNEGDIVVYNEVRNNGHVPFVNGNLYKLTKRHYDWWEVYEDKDKLGIWNENLRLATKEEQEAYNQGVRNIKDIKKSNIFDYKNLISGEIYTFNYGHSAGSSVFINKIKDPIKRSCYSVNGDMFEINDYYGICKNIRFATLDEKQWLEACIKANKFVSKEEALKSTSSLIKKESNKMNEEDELFNEYEESLTKKKNKFEPIEIEYECDFEEVISTKSPFKRRNRKVGYISNPIRISVS